MIENLIINPELFNKAVIGIVIQYLLSIGDLFQCVLFSGPVALVACFGRALCLALGLGALCPAAPNCPCFHCESGWRIGVNLESFILTPCTVAAGCVCNPLHTIMIGFLNLFNSL